MSADGSWQLRIDSAMGNLDMDFVLREEAGTLTGSASAPDRNLNTEIFDGTVNGNDLFWKVKVRRPVRLTVGFTVTVDGDTINGKAKAGAFGSFPVTGRRVS